MTDHPGFVYMDEASIDEEFRCLICNEPFEKPTTTPCDHTFCLSCINQWLQRNTDKNKACPTCRHPLSIVNDLKPASRIISNRIDRYLVKCLACGVDKILRGSFADHVSKMCTNAEVLCLASDISCPWIGPRYALNEHLKSCPYQQIRPAIETIQAKNNLLEQQLVDINQRYQAQQHQINELIAMIKSMNSYKNVSIKRIINFEDLIEQAQRLNSYDHLPSDYAGFQWLNGAFMPRQHGKTSYPNTGFATAFEQEQKCVVFNFGCQPISMRDCHSTFCILSFLATCAFQDEVTLTVIGRRSQKKVETATFILRWNELKMFNLYWNNIDQLEFAPSGGKQLSSSRDTDRHVILASLNFG